MPSRRARVATPHRCEGHDFITSSFPYSERDLLFYTNTEKFYRI
jgi:hypothetical protein